MNYLLPEGAHTERLLFRKMREGDFDALLPHFKDPQSTKYLGTYKGTAEERCRSLIKTVLDRYKKGHGLMAIEERKSGKLIGMCGLLVQDIDDTTEIEIGYHILPAERRKGYASEAAIKCKTHAFENGLCQSLVSIIHRENSNSIKVAENNGMLQDKETTWRNSPVKVFRINNQ